MGKKDIPTIAFWGLILALIWPQMYFTSDAGVFAGSRTVWADWPAHLTYINVFANLQISQWFTQNPLFLGGNFNYPFASSLISGMLMRLGVSQVNSLIVPSFLASMFLVVSLVKLLSLYTSSSKRLLLATSLVFFSGGFGVIFIINKVIHSDSSIDSLLQTGFEFTLNAKDHIHFGNFLFTEFIPQRAMLLGLPICLILSYLLVKWYRRDFSDSKFWHLSLFGFAFGCLPFIHLHSLLTIAILLVTFFIFKPQNIKSFIKMGLGSLIPLSLWYYFIFRHSSNNNSLRVFLGWYAGHDKVNLFYFWFINLGLFLPIALYGTFQRKLYRDPLVFTGWILFVLGNTVQFQPWLWDNMKIFTYSYIFLVPAVLPIFDQVHSLSGVKSKLLSGLIIVTLLASGALESLRLLVGRREPYLMLSRSDMMLASEFNEISSPDDIVLTSDRHLNWVPTLTGRRILMGYRGWLWSYGINYDDRERDMKKMFQGLDPTLELFNQYDIDFVAIGPEELTNWNANLDFFETQRRDAFELVLQNESYRVFKRRRL